MQSPERVVRLNANTNLLKLIAIISMLIDHLGAAIFPQYSWMRVVGRIAFPIICYCLAVGSIYTRNMPRYLLRVALMGLISQPFYVLALSHITPAMRTLDFAQNPLLATLKWYALSMQYANIMFELLLGLLLIWTIKTKQYVLTGVMALVVWYVSPYLATSYGVRGVVLMLLFYAFFDKPLTSLVLVCGYMLWWGMEGSGYSIGSARFGLQAFAVLALPAIYWPCRTRMKLNKWVFYIFYPLHLALIYAWSVFK